MPLDSPGNPEPVFSPMPNLDRYLCKTSFGINSPINIEPVLLETARIPDEVNR